MTTPKLTVKAGHVRPLYIGHPWVFQQAVERIEGGALPGDEVQVMDPTGRALGRGLYSPKSAIVVRLFTRNEEPLDAAFFKRRLTSALRRRAAFGLPSADGPERTDAFRWVHGEGDGLPGLIVDKFGRDVVVQLGTIGLKRREGMLLDLIHELVAPRAILDRTPESVVRLEGFTPTRGVVRGDLALSALEFVENGFAFRIPLELSQKTGYYLDQRALRLRVGELCRGKSVVDAHSYVGAFALAAARGGATSVTAIDENATALAVGAEIARANHLPDRITFLKDDAVRALTAIAQRDGADVVLADPPKLAPSKSNRDAALLGYRKIAKAALRATKPFGLTVLSSCSAAVSMDDLIRVVAVAAREIRMTATVLERHGQRSDHPVPSAFGDGFYLKSLVIQAEPLA